MTNDEKFQLVLWLNLKKNTPIIHFATFCRQFAACGAWTTYFAIHFINEYGFG